MNIITLEKETAIGQSHSNLPTLQIRPSGDIAVVQQKRIARTVGEYPHTYTSEDWSDVVVAIIPAKRRNEIANFIRQ